MGQQQQRQHRRGQQRQSNIGGAVDARHTCNPGRVIGCWSICSHDAPALVFQVGSTFQGRNIDIPSDTNLQRERAGGRVRHDCGYMQCGCSYMQCGCNVVALICSVVAVCVWQCGCSVAAVICSVAAVWLQLYALWQQQQQCEWQGLRC